MPYTGTVPYTDNTVYTQDFLYTENVPYTSQTFYTSSIAYSSDNPYSSEVIYSSATEYTSAQDPDTYAYSAILKVKQAASNSVSTISSLVVSTTQTIKSIIVSTLGNQISASAYSDSAATTQIGDTLVYTATGATVGTTYGIAISPAEYDQSDIIGTEIIIEPNQ